MLYDSDSLTKVQVIFNAQPMTRCYHFVFGDGQTEKPAVKIRAHLPESPGQQVAIWEDNDPTMNSLRTSYPALSTTTKVAFLF